MSTTTDRLGRLSTLAAVLLVLFLQAAAVTKQSIVGDGPYHLLAGHQALRYGENRLNLEHPPLVKLVAALPLLLEEPLAPPTTVDQALINSLRIFDDPHRLERIRLRSRVLLLLVFGLPFLGATYLLGREVGGPRVGFILAILIGLSISVVPYLSILQTDAAVSLGYVLFVVAFIRYLKAPSMGRAVLVGVGAGLALAAKFSGVLILPVLSTALFVPKRGWRRLSDLAVAGTAAISLVWATYALANLHYDPEGGRDTITRYCRGEALIVDDRMKDWEGPLLATERISPSFAQWLTGFLGIRAQNTIGVYPTFAFGELRSAGRWWYFPAVFVVKTPLVILAAILAALVNFVRTFAKVPPRRVPPVLLAGGLTAAVYLSVAMTSSYNLGARHLMPILPILFLPASLWAAERKWRSITLLLILASESVLLSPLWMSATHTWWLGSHNPTRFAFSIGDAEYRQNFIALADAVKRRGIDRLYVLYPSVSEREIQAYLPEAAVPLPHLPPEPGWYAVNIAVEQYLPAIPRTHPDDVRGYGGLAQLADTWGPFWHEIAEKGEDKGYAASTFHFYLLDE